MRICYWNKFGFEAIKWGTDWKGGDSVIKRFFFIETERNTVHYNHWLIALWVTWEYFNRS